MPLSVTPLARALRVADVAKQIDADYDQLLQRLSEAALALTASWAPYMAIGVSGRFGVPGGFTLRTREAADCV